MTASANVQTAARRGSIETLVPTDAVSDRTAGHLPGHGDHAEAGTGLHERLSPDPNQHTDRYRLVTPFSLRL